MAQNPKTDSPLPANGKTIYFVKLAVTSYSAPIGKISESENIWSYVSQSAVRTLSDGIFARNGIKIGIGTSQSRAEMEKTLSLIAEKNANARVTMSPAGHANDLTINSHKAPSPIFTFHADQTASGAEYPPGDGTLAIIAAPASDKRDAITLTVMPKIVSSTRQPEYILTEERASMEMRAKEYPFNQLACEMTVEKGGFIIVGPGSYARKDNSLGKHFFVSRKDSIDFENIFVIVPELVEMTER